MKQMFLAIVGLVLPFFLFQDVASAQTKEKTAAEVATEEADRLAELLDLEGWQVFYVDSTLQHDYTLLEKELKDLQSSRVDNMDLYMTVRDRWADKIDAAFKGYFTEEQWTKYLKNGAGKMQKARAKRAEKRNK